MGAFVDNRLQLTSHINELVRSCFYHLRRIRSIRRFLPISCVIKLVVGLVLSRLDYCNSLLAGLPSCQLSRIQTVLNAAARMIFRCAPFDHVGPLLHRLHWLRIRERVTFKLCLLVFKSLSGDAPSYLSEHCALTASTCTRYSLRSNVAYQLNVPRSVNAFGRRSFRIFGPSAWNSLPPSVRQSPTLNT